MPCLAEWCCLSIPERKALLKFKGLRETWLKLISEVILFYYFTSDAFFRTISYHSVLSGDKLGKKEIECQFTNYWATGYDSIEDKIAYVPHNNLIKSLGSSFFFLTKKGGKLIGTHVRQGFLSVFQYEWSWVLWIDSCCWDGIDLFFTADTIVFQASSSIKYFVVNNSWDRDFKFCIISE